MYTEAYMEGFEKAAKDLGLHKTAYIKGLKNLVMLGRAPGAVSATAGKSWGKRIGNFMIGEPRKFLQEIKSKQPFAKGSLLHSNIEDIKSPLGMGLIVGLPAYNIGSTIMDKEPNKARRIGEELGGAALGTALWRPLGMLGSMAGYTAGSKLLGGLGSGVDKLTGSTPPQNNVVPYQGV